MVISRAQNDFVFLGKVGKGAFGVVYKVRNKLDGNLYALKLVKCGDDERMKTLREVNVLSRLTHDNVVRYYNSWLEDEVDDIPCLPDKIYANKKKKRAQRRNSLQKRRNRQLKVEQDSDDKGNPLIISDDDGQALDRLDNNIKVANNNNNDRPTDADSDAEADDYDLPIFKQKAISSKSVNFSLPPKDFDIIETTTKTTTTTTETTTIPTSAMSKSKKNSHSHRLNGVPPHLTQKLKQKLQTRLLLHRHRNASSKHESGVSLNIVHDDDDDDDDDDDADADDDDDNADDDGNSKSKNKVDGPDDEGLKPVPSIESDQSFDLPYHRKESLSEHFHHESHIPTTYLMCDICGYAYRDWFVTDEEWHLAGNEYLAMNLCETCFLKTLPEQSHVQCIRSFSDSSEDDNVTLDEEDEVSDEDDDDDDDEDGTSSYSDSSSFDYDDDDDSDDDENDDDDSDDDDDIDDDDDDSYDAYDEESEGDDPTGITFFKVDNAISFEPAVSEPESFLSRKTSKKTKDRNKRQKSKAKKKKLQRKNSQKHSLYLHIQMEWCTLTLTTYIDNLDINDLGSRWLAVQQILQGLEYLHSHGVVHRDIKPANIFFHHSRIKLGDLGLAKFLHSSTLISEPSAINLHLLTKKDTTNVGTPSYRAPDSHISFKSDMYSFGIVMFEIFNKFSTKMERASEMKCLVSDERPCDSFLESHPLASSIITKVMSKDVSKRLTASEALAMLPQQFCMHPSARSDSPTSLLSKSSVRSANSTGSVSSIGSSMGSIVDRSISELMVSASTSSLDDDQQNVWISSTLLEFQKQHQQDIVLARRQEIYVASLKIKVSQYEEVIAQLQRDKEKLLKENEKLTEKLSAKEPGNV